MKETTDTENPKFTIQYIVSDDDGRDTNVFPFSDFQKDKIELATVEVKDFLDASISFLYLDDDSGEEVWWKAEVADIDHESPDPQNPNFFIYFLDGHDPSNIEYFDEPLIELYHNGDVRLLDCPQDNGSTS